MQKKKEKIDWVILIFLLTWLPLMLAAWDQAKPSSSTSLRDSNPEILANWVAIESSFGAHHEFSTGGTNTGDNLRIKFNAPISTPTYAANKGWVYSKDVSSVVELHWLDESNNEVQITSGGYINGAVLLADSVDSAHYAAGSVDSEHLEGTLPDGADLAAATEAGDGDRTIADKAYVESYGNALCVNDGTTVFNTTLTTAETWQDLDLSSYVGSNFAIVYLEIYCSPASDNALYFYAKTKGYGSNTTTEHRSEGSSQVVFNYTNEHYYGYIVTATDTSGVIQIGCENNTDTVTIKLVGYVK